MKKTSLIVHNNLLYIAWLQATVATMGSLFFSEVMKLPPCTLCWYQRICMYPLMPIILVGMIKNDKYVGNYILPISGIGTAIALYHNLLYYKILPESMQSCSIGVSCTSRYIEWFGFVTIPLLSLAAFIIIDICTLLYINRNKI
jgi:disulfide bond formation protein DsbB